MSRPGLPATPHLAPSLDDVTPWRTPAPTVGDVPRMMRLSCFHQAHGPEEKAWLKHSPNS